MDGWVKLYRCSLENPVVCKDSDFFAVWCYLLLNATHQPIDAIFKGERITLQEGQLITGRNSISEKFSINPSKVQRILKKLEIEHQIEQQTGNKNRLISIVKWDLYQQSEQQNEQQLNNNRTTTEQQLNTNKNKRTKEQKNINNKDIESIPYQQIADMYNDTCVSFPKVTTLSDKRKKAIKARLNTYTEDDFKRLFEMAEDSDFLKGKNGRDWRATFDWLIADGNMAKVLDGNYKNKEGGNSGGNSKRSDSSNGTPASNVEDEGERLNRIGLEKLREHGKQLEDIECDF